MPPTRAHRFGALAPMWLGLAALAVALVAAPGCSFLDDGDASSSTTTAPPSATSSTVPTGSPTAFAHLLPGQCFDQLPSREQQPFAVLVIPCEQPHSFELFDQIIWTDQNGHRANLSITFPDDTAVRTRAEALCLERFEPWVGESWTESDYDLQVWWPSAESWGHGDRTVLCAVYRFDGKRSTGTARASG